MKDLRQLYQDIEKIENRLREVLPDIAIILTLSVKAIAERTIKDKGFGRQYSEKKVPAFFLEGKELNASGKNFIDKKIEDHEESNWKEFRQAQGLPSGFVDLTYTGFMWSNMIPQPVEQSGDIYSAPLAASNKEVQKKMDWNRDRYGDFIGQALTEEDFQNLMKIIVDEMIQAIQDLNL